MLLALLALACHPAESLCDEATGGGEGENVLIILTDDIGIDNTGAYGEHPDPPPTPNIDALAARGVLFRNAYATPLCSPTRAALLTGRMPTRTGIGTFIDSSEEWRRLAPAELTIPEVLFHSPHDYVSAAVGKWHLSSFLYEDPAEHPLLQGFRCHAGALANAGDAWMRPNVSNGYFRWEKATDGTVAWSSTYVTTDTTDEALARIAHTREPWFVYVAYNGAHNPLHVPPDELHSQELGPDSTPLEQYRAMVEATDTEIGRLLDGIPDEILARTTIIYASDNGSPPEGTSPPWDPARQKGTVYEGGVNVPLIVAGPQVGTPGSESAALVHLADLMPTVAELAHVDLASLLAQEDLVIDSQSLVPWLRDPEAAGAREAVFTEGFALDAAGAVSKRQRMVRELDWKLVRLEEAQATRDELYRMEAEAWDEGEDLLAGGEEGLDVDALEALDRLREELDAMAVSLDDRSTWTWASGVP